MSDLPKLSELTPEQKRAMIAEACGWEKVPRENFEKFPLVTWPVFEKGGKRASIITDTLPDYLGSLDAMHEAEMAIPRHDLGAYTMQLRRIIQRDCNTPEHYVDGCDRAQLIADFWFYHATASQRAEAFLLATGKAQP